MLVFDCAGTVNKTVRTLRQIDQSVVEDSTDTELARVRKLYNGFVLSEPLDATKELIQHVDPEEASLIGFFFDRWQRFAELEKRYSDSYAKLLDAVAKTSSNATDATYFEAVKPEYWQQVNGSLKEIRRSLVDLGYLSCKLFRSTFRATRLGRNFTQIDRYSNGRWKNWQDFENDEAEFARLRSAKKVPP